MYYIYIYMFIPIIDLLVLNANCIFVDKSPMTPNCLLNHYN